MGKEFGINLFKPFVEAGYDPDNPSKEAIAKIKKQHKSLRGISKAASLGKSYGMGWQKFQQTMLLQGQNLSEEECQAVIQGLDKVYSGVKRYSNYLEKERRDNGGWVLNGIGRPVGCAEDYIKDIGNRVVQSTGHDILMMWISIYSKMLDDAGISWDGVILDFHDQSIIECNAEDLDTVLQIFKVDSVIELNKQLDGIIPMKVDGGPITTLADAKCED